MADMNDLIKISTVEFADIVKDYDMIDVKLLFFKSIIKVLKRRSIDG